MGWRYYAQRATTGEWLDTNAQLNEEVVSWALSSPNSGQALILPAQGNPIAEDGRPVFGKFDTILLVEDEDEELIWFGICTEANPVANGTALEFIGLTGWWAGVPYLGEYSTWKTPIYNAIREIMTATRTEHVKPAFPVKITYLGGNTTFIGDPEPPLRKGGAAGETWEEEHGWKQPYELVWWESPTVGKEIDDIVKQYGLNYVEVVRWTDRARLKYEVEVIFDDGLADYRRFDIEFIDGVNLAKPIDVKPGNAKFANRVIALGAGEGRDMLRVDVGGNDGRMYQAEVLNYKALSNQDQLRRMAQHDLKYLKSDGVKIETLTVWDTPDSAPLSTLVPGWEVAIRSSYTTPATDVYSRVISITRTPNSALAVVNFEVAS